MIQRKLIGVALVFNIALQMILLGTIAKADESSKYDQPTLGITLAPTEGLKEVSQKLPKGWSNRHRRNTKRTCLQCKT